MEEDLTLNDEEFLDTIYAGFAKTTRASDSYWMPEEVKDRWDTDCCTGEEVKEPGYGWDVFAVDKDDIKTKVAWFCTEADAGFLCALHGCLPDLVRRMHDALDEADRLDRERDEREVALAILTQEADQLAADHAEAEQNVFRLAVENDELRAEAAQLRRERESWVSRAGDTLWKIERPM